jgi:hypothetical protein
MHARTLRCVPATVNALRDAVATAGIQLMPWQGSRAYDPGMAVDENAVWNIVNITLGKHRGAGGCCGPVCDAWQELYIVRNFSSSAYDPEALAIAEHYLYARCKVCSAEVSQAQMKVMVRGYDWAKRVVPDGVMRSNRSQPTTPPSDEAIRWGLKGADDGEADRLRCNPAKEADKITVPKFFKSKYGY